MNKYTPPWKLFFNINYLHHQVASFVKTLMFTIPCSQKQSIHKKPQILRYFQVMTACNKVKISFDRSDETIRCSLVPHLSAAFGRKGISVLTDKHDEFCKCIASVFIFSKNYVSIKESLDDFFKTSQRRHGKGHVVATVFYGVNRSELEENVAKALSEHCTSYQASQWLEEIITLPGHEKINKQRLATLFCDLLNNSCKLYLLDIIFENYFFQICYMSSSSSMSKMI